MKTPPTSIPEEDALVFNSGSSAIYAAIMANIKSGDHIISVNKPYTWAQRLFDNILPRFNVKVTYVDGTAIDNFRNAVLPETAIIYLESPNSLTFEIQDIRAVAQLGHVHKILTIIDNSYCTPLYQNPLSLGIDLSLQSASKYLGGHSDTVAGVLSGSKELIQKIFNDQLLSNGSGITPFNAWLIIRGLRTLPIRLKQITSTTNQVIKFLKQHPKVEKVIFPFDPTNPQYELAKSQMSGACGLFSIILKTDSYHKIERFSFQLKHFLVAVSWGGYESLIMPQAAGIGPENFDAQIENHKLVRLFIGLEEDYLIEDLNQALEIL